MLPALTPEQSKYTSDVLQKLIDIKMERKIKLTNNDSMVIEVDEVIIVPPDIKHPNWPKTIEAIKYIIDSGLDRLNQFGVDFNNNYSKFRKYKINN